jgi:hypothetical protein
VGEISGKLGGGEGLALEGRNEGDGSFIGDGMSGCGGFGCEGVATVPEHVLGEVASVHEGGDPQVGHHGVGLPAADKLDDVGLNASTQQGGGVG